MPGMHRWWHLSGCSFHAPYHGYYCAAAARWFTGCAAVLHNSVVSGTCMFEAIPQPRNFLTLTPSQKVSSKNKCTEQICSMKWYLFFLASYKHLNNDQKLTQAVQLYWHIMTFRSAAGLIERLGKAKNSVSVHRSTEIVAYLPGNCLTGDGHTCQPTAIHNGPSIVCYGSLYCRWWWSVSCDTTKRSVKHVLQAHLVTYLALNTSWVTPNSPVIKEGDTISHMHEQGSTICVYISQCDSPTADYLCFDLCGCRNGGF